jgi:predicted alpha/beta-hydrolase family hydrolase
MSLNIPSLNFYHTSNTEKLIIVTHGASEGIDSSFIEKIIQKVKIEQTSVLAVQMPYKDRGENQSSGKELKEELEAVQKALEFVRYQDFKKLHFIGKSLGGIIFSRYLQQQPTELQSKSDLTILGYIYGDTVTPEAVTQINIIQGEKDKYGTPEQLQEEIDKSAVKNITLNLVEGADHSYRNSNKEPEFQDRAIELI